MVAKLWYQFFGHGEKGSTFIPFPDFSHLPCYTSGQSTVSNLALSKWIGIPNSREFWEYNCQSGRGYARETAITRWSALHVTKCNTKGGFRSKYTCTRILEKLQRHTLVLNLLTWWGLGNSFGTMTLFIWYVAVIENIGHIYLSCAAITCCIHWAVVF